MSDIEKPTTTHTNGPATTTTTAAPASRFRKLANPGPLGLCSFASTTLILSLYNVNAGGVHKPNVVVGMALFVGGLAQLLAGMWEFAAGNTLGATAFPSYGAFWLSYATILIPGSGITAAYTGADAETLNDALGIFLGAWFIFTFICLLATFRTNAGLVALFFFLDLTFLLLLVGEVLVKPAVTRAGGGFGILTAFIAYYVGTAELLAAHNGAFSLPLFPLAPRKVD